ncbi:MAG: flagellar hook-associated protein FlgK [Pseudomonadota bacterium]
MSLDVAANIARQSLIASQYQLSLSGRNVSAAADPDRARVAPTLATTIDGGIRVAGVRRAEDTAVYNRMVAATAAAAERDAVLSQMNVLAQSVGDPQNGTSIGAMIGELQSAVANYANAPDDPLFGRTVIERAHDIADKLNRVTSDMLLLREQADAEMARSVDEVNRLLVEFDAANDAVVQGTVRGTDITMELDRRDALVADIAQHLGVDVIRGENNDYALYTDGGVTLYEHGIRTVSFARTAVYTPGANGGQVFVDGLEVTGPDAPMPSRTGAIVGNAAVRDTIVPTFQLQMDEIARELTTIFADGTGSLFVNGGGPDFAGTIAVAADVDPAQGGTVENLRDGTGNPGGFAAFSDRLFALGDALTAVTTFDPQTELASNSRLTDFATESAGWVEAIRQTVTIQAETEQAILIQAQDALSRATGVNLDDEYAQQLMIERNFNASSRLIGIIDEMFETLLRIT